MIKFLQEQWSAIKLRGPAFFSCSFICPTSWLHISEVKWSAVHNSTFNSQTSTISRIRWTNLVHYIETACFHDTADNSTCSIGYSHWWRYKTHQKQLITGSHDCRHRVESREKSSRQALRDELHAKRSEGGGRGRKKTGVREYRKLWTV